MLMLQRVKPTTSSRRHLVKLNQKRLNLSKKSVLKNKIKGIKNSDGRNNSGKITVFHKGGGVKKKYRQINFNRNYSSSGVICSLEHDPNRNCYIASVFDFINNDFFYMIAPKHLKVGNIVKSGWSIQPSLGSSLPLSKIPIGTHIHNVSTKLNSKSQISRSAGTFSVIKEKTKKRVLITLSSGETKFVSSKCFASVGKVSKELFISTKLGKAGQSRWLNKRPTVRGVAMNPVDHPHGGGEGKKSGISKTPWGKQNKRGKTGCLKNFRKK